MERSTFQQGENPRLFMESDRVGWLNILEQHIFSARGLSLPLLILTQGIPYKRVMSPLFIYFIWCEEFESIFQSSIVIFIHWGNASEEHFWGNVNVTLRDP